MVVSLALLLEDHARLLENVGRVGRADDRVGRLAEPDLDELAKATAVVITQCLGIAPSLKNRRSLEDFRLNACG